MQDVLAAKLRKLRALANDAGATAGERNAAEAMAKKVEQKILHAKAAAATAEKIKVEAAEPVQEKPAPAPALEPEPYPISAAIERFLQHPLGSLAAGVFFLTTAVVMKAGAAIGGIAAIFYIVAILAGAIAAIDRNRA